MSTPLKRLVISSLLAALCIVATTIIVIPSPFKGYLNMGDVVVLLIAWILPMRYAFLAAGLGSCLSDLLLSYALYAPATFIIKGMMAVVANHYIKHHHKRSSRLVSGILAECIMVFGYLAFETILYGFVPSLVNIPINVTQGVVCLIIALQVIKIFDKTNFQI